MATEPQILNGVYKIKNVDNGLYLDVRGGGTTSGTAVQQWTYSTSYEKHQLFKITYLGTYGTSKLNYYSIRPLTNSSLGMSAPYSGSGGNVTISEMATTDTWAIPYKQCWAIAEDGSYYTIRNGSES